MEIYLKLKIIVWLLQPDAEPQLNPGALLAK